MGDELQIRGVVGQIKWAWHVAAALHGFEVILNKRTGGGTLRGTIVVTNPTYLAQSPLEFVLPYQGGTQRWRIDHYELEHPGTVRATLSPIQE